ncbi:lipopolysaccharide heptosyltransferase II [Candidatus Omnitrophus magneticus]|uniref:Lipopolysaccharide heptosyltransferase II n=1 Tax=Candidatus Omnitrophus magneticus TaxID=1609969 RepID=A0A0F0CPS7_9BACT|nr:lipopolysaccharide heptosyltransferase II [Candidatus Omnitrophus magneticus]
MSVPLNGDVLKAVYNWDKSINMKTPKRILIANIFGIGDVVFTLPIVDNLKNMFEGSRVDYLCNARVNGVLELVSGIDNIHIYEKDKYLNLWKNSKRLFVKEVLNLFFSIKKKKYDIVFDFTLSREFGFVFLLCGIKRRIGFDYKNRGIFLTDKMALTGFDGKHVVEFYLELLKYAGIDARVFCPAITPDEYSLKWAKNYLLNKNVEKDRLIFIIPGGGASWGKDAVRKRWPDENFAIVADALINEKFQICILGAHSERVLCETVANKMKFKPSFIENDLDIKKYIALLSLGALVITNDGGPLHLASALGRKVVAIFGPVDENVYGPYPKDKNCNRVLTVDGLQCRPCYKNFRLSACKLNMLCLYGVHPNDIIKECGELLADKLSHV